MAVGQASASESLELGQRDCTEFASLTVAMCRAVQIPARLVTGLAYVPGRNVFSHHAWAQVWTGEAWVSVDAAYDTFYPGHIALACGKGAETFAEARDAMGRLRMVDLRQHF